MKPILEVKGIGKKFRIHHEKQHYLSIRESMMNMLRFSKESDEDFWALKNISFDVYPGESLAIIGRNGAGKSTLLKILSKITPPTKGEIITRGRIASLLEVGTGFHPELSGRENIYLNGSILGLKKKEIDTQFDAIVDFSGIEKFLDTPLKRYSSGMQLRLAFAVAAHLEPEVLVIDEVLAVGDAEFQKKCIGKMSEVSSSGRTILFVSHNMGLVSQLCNKAVVLKGGEVAMHGHTNDAIDFYLAQSRHDTGEYVTPNVKALSERPMFFNKIRTLNDQGNLKSEFSFFEHINIEFKITLNKYVAGAKVGFAMLDRNNARVFSEYFRLSEEKHKPGEYTFKAKVPKGIIAPGNYSFLAALLVEGDIFHLVEEICSVRIIDTGTELAMHEGYHYGSIILKCDWE